MTKILKINPESPEPELVQQAVSIIGFLRREIPGFQNAYIGQISPEVQRRETRRIVGDYVMTAEELLKPVKFPDSVAKSGYPIEVHNPDTGQREWQIPQRAYYVPYRVFHPSGAENLIVGSARSLSVTHEVAGALRVSPLPIATGQATGVAAALAALQGITPAKVDAAEVREKLVGQGAVVE